MLLGSGELGKEFVIACQRKGQYVVACDSYQGAPAMQVADECRVFSMLDGDALMKAVEEVKPDIIVPEIEAIRTERLYDCEKQGIQVVPSAKAVNFTMNRKAIRELAHTELGLKTANYKYASTYEELLEAPRRCGDGLRYRGRPDRDRDPWRSGQPPPRSSRGCPDPFQRQGCPAACPRPAAA